MIQSFSIARIPEIHFGTGRLYDAGKLSRRFGETILVITGRSVFNETGEKLSEVLRQADMKLHIEIISGEPSPDRIDSICQHHAPKKIDVVLATGGGSVLDAGKAVSAMIRLNEPVTDYLEGVGTKSHSGAKVPFIAIPTTSGTGSEATKNAVLSQPGENGFKKSLRHPNFVPDVAIVDPELTLTLPPDVTAACGMDALTQLLESFVSTNASEMTDTLALSGLEHIARSLIPAVKQGDTDIKARAGMAYAAMLSGITLANAGLGVVHGFASPIGGFFDIPHGVVCGTLMGACTRKNIERLIESGENPEALEKYAKAGNILLNENNKDIPGQALELATLIDEWIDELGISGLGRYGITENDIDKIVNHSGQKNNPVHLSKDDMQFILKQRL